MTLASAIFRIVGLTHRYSERVALDHLDLEIQRGDFFAILGPNGGGKTTLFRILSTLIPVQQGEVFFNDIDFRTSVQPIREQLGIVFQSPSLDKKLTVSENLWCQGKMYGLDNATIRQRGDELLKRFDLTQRSGDRVETLSGGLKRRVEIIKSLLHQPTLLLLDEPSTGLDPLVRSELIEFLQELRTRHELTILLTTHFLEEADKADRVAILHQGKLVALDAPGNLRSSLAGESLSIQVPKPEQFIAELQQRLQLTAKVIDNTVRLDIPHAHQWIAKIVEAFPGQIQTITLGKPTLEDVFIARTGHRFHSEPTQSV